MDRYVLDKKVVLWSELLNKVSLAVLDRCV